MQTTAVTYWRTAHDPDGASAHRQADRLARLAAARGVQVVADYADHEVSGMSEDRPALARLIADSRAGRFAEVLVTDLARLARSHPVVAGILDALGVAVVADDGVQGATLPPGSVTRLILGGAR